MLAATRQFHDDMRAYGWMVASARMCFYECMFTPLQVNTLFTAALHVTEKLIVTDAVLMEQHGARPTKRGDWGGRGTRERPAGVDGQDEGESSAGVTSTVRGRPRVLLSQSPGGQQ